MELICGGELYKRLKKVKRYSEKDASLLIYNLLQSLKYMHTQKIIHRDLKLENILLREKQNNIKIKLADFGLSTFTSNITLFKHCGTPGYIAPEVLMDKQYDTQADMFSVGVIGFSLLSGCWPFPGKNKQEVLSKNKDGMCVFKGKY